MWVEEDHIQPLILALEHAFKEDGSPLEYTISDRKSQTEVMMEKAAEEKKRLEKELAEARSRAAQ